MTSRSASLTSRMARTFGVAALFALLGATVLPVPGCSDEPTPQPPPGACSSGDVENADDKDCKQRVCQNGTFVDQAADTEIPDDANECTTDTCMDGQAQHAPAMGACTVAGVAGTCVDGTCKVTCAMDADCNDNSSCTTDKCDASMTCTFTDNPANYDDNNDCTTDSCMGGVEKHDNAPVGTACGATGVGMCDGNGVCAGCSADTDCPADEPCLDHYCDLATTLCQAMPKPDGDLPDDTPFDCQIPSCVGGQMMTNPNDADLPDDGNECTVDTCSAGVPANDPAMAETMCATGVCDGVSACVQCVTAANCMGDFSCSMNMCFDCGDGMKNGTESDVDCGSDCATKCVDGKACTVNSDCFYGTCDNMLCVSCFDGTMNADESDIDCGGVCGATCGVNEKCNAGTDCTTGVCNAVTKVCAAPTCMDMVKNGTESDVDCGGACPKCAAGKMCKVNSDCVGGTMCLMGVCG
jgi:hypothetical protein